MLIDIIKQEVEFKPNFGRTVKESYEDFMDRINETLNMYTSDMEVIDINFIIQDELIWAIIKYKVNI
jgi:hypothetical protein